MPSFNIKDYIIAGLLLALVVCGTTLFFAKLKIDSLQDYKDTALELVAAQKKKIEIIKRNSKKTEEYLNEKYEVEISGLNNTIERMRHSRPNLMPPIPKSSKDPRTAYFEREELAAAIERYRAGVQELVRKGSEGILESNICKEWIEQQQKIYEVEPRA